MLNIGAQENLKGWKNLYITHSIPLLEIQKDSCSVQHSLISQIQIYTYLLYKLQSSASISQKNTYLLLKNKVEKDQDLHSGKYLYLDGEQNV